MPATSPPPFICTSCGTGFDLPAPVRDKYPGWTPKECSSCRGGAGTNNARTGNRRRDKAARGRGGASRGKTLVEENLTVAEVLERYTEGPSDGVFTDGSAVPNPGPGGWGAVYVVDGQVVDQIHGHEASTTNNRMELTALIAAYDLVPEGTPTTVYTDSNLAVRTITEWAAGWERLGWKRKTGAIQNLELVQELYRRATSRPEIELRWIKAHAGSRWNEYADALSTAWLREQL